MPNLGDKGQEIGKLHQQLLEAGETIDQEEQNNQEFGPLTQVALKDFQQHHVDSKGIPLIVDGKIGPNTEWALEHPSGPAGDDNYYAPGWYYHPLESPDNTREVCNIACTDIGLHESPDGSNNGPDLQKFKTYGQPWCALAVSEWYLSCINGSPFGRKASVLSVVEWAKQNQHIVDSNDVALPGDLACFLRAGGHGHICLVVSVEGEKLYTVEGNCGNAVRACIRERSKLQALVRPYK